MRGKIGLWESNDVPFIHLGSENLVLCFSLKIEMFNSGPGDENCQRHGFWFKKKKKRKLLWRRFSKPIKKFFPSSTFRIQFAISNLLINHSVFLAAAQASSSENR